jgi:hypothetical protein
MPETGYDRRYRVAVQTVAQRKALAGDVNDNNKGYVFPQLHIGKTKNRKTFSALLKCIYSIQTWLLILK